MIPDAKPIKIKKPFLCKECTYAQKDINENDEKIDSTEDIETTFLSSYFLENPVFNVEIIEESLNEINLDRVQKKGENCHLMNMKKLEQFNTKRGK